MRLVEVLDGVFEFVPLLAVAQQFHYLLATFDVLWFRLSYSALLLLSLVSDRAECILRPFALVFLLRLLSLEVPGPALVVRKVLPGHTNDLGERAMVRLDLGGDVLTFDKRRTEEDERVGRARDIARAFPTPRLGVIVGIGLFLRREDVGGRGLERWRTVVRESGRCNVGSELDSLQSGLYRRGPFQIEM